MRPPSSEQSIASPTRPVSCSPHWSRTLRRGTARQKPPKRACVRATCHRLLLCDTKYIMELQRALSDLAEVRERLAHLQRFEGYSGAAACVSGIGALIAAVVQHKLSPLPHTPDSLRQYLTIWLTCLAVALLLNYGAAAVWLLKHRAPGARSRFRTAAISIAPSIVLGGALSIALIDHGAYSLLPGTWFAFYAIGLFASRGSIPTSTIVVTAFFALLALAFLITPLVVAALAWWVMPLGFGAGQLVIGYFIWVDRRP